MVVDVGPLRRSQRGQVRTVAGDEQRSSDGVMIGSALLFFPAEIVGEVVWSFDKRCIVVRLLHQSVITPDGRVGHPSLEVYVSKLMLQRYLEQADEQKHCKEDCCRRKTCGESHSACWQNCTGNDSIYGPAIVSQESVVQIVAVISI